ncbi:hypothetical protein SAMN05444411_102150 [Lutibacter oricola]|uniref:Uncharacterized protein n=1 Tax=Lutibacter oricola TaxID=762486 RepID=A0A1H2WAF9_9FLAO|nr:hypothetical protein [Lutibacter oricola]SDW77612.1 hypothetical protein SAMN05444411_102150 [Lutibacter oricola]
MNSVIKNILAVILGLAIGSIVNMGIITISGSVIPPPEGVDPTSMQSLKETMHLFRPKHYLMPFLAHALGAFVGAFVASVIAKKSKLKMALIVGVLFLIGGVINVFMLPSPIWFAVLDIAVAYLPMAWFGYKLSENFTKK